MDVVKRSFKMVIVTDVATYLPDVQVDGASSLSAGDAGQARHTGTPCSGSLPRVNQQQYRLHQGALYGGSHKPWLGQPYWKVEASSEPNVLGMVSPSVKCPCR